MAQRQRKGMPAKESGGGNTMFYIVLGVIALGGILAIVYALTGGSGGAATEMVQLDETDVQALYAQATPIRMGEEEAPVKIVEFADYQCPGCGAFALQVKPRIMPYIESGVAQFIYYDFPLGGGHVHAFLAARAARCAGEQELDAGTGQDAYWTYHDKLYQEQQSWSSQQSVVGDYVDYAEEVGLQREEFENCLRSDRHAEVVTANRLLGDQLGVRSTPTILVNNRQVGGNSIQNIGDNLIEMIEEIRSLEESTE